MLLVIIDDNLHPLIQLVELFVQENTITNILALLYNDKLPDNLDNHENKVEYYPIKNKQDLTSKELINYITSHRNKNEGIKILIDLILSDRQSLNRNPFQTITSFEELYSIKFAMALDENNIASKKEIIFYTKPETYNLISEAFYNDTNMERFLLSKPSFTGFDESEQEIDFITEVLQSY